MSIEWCPGRYWLDKGFAGSFILKILHHFSPKGGGYWNVLLKNLCHISVITEKIYHLFLIGPFLGHVWNFIYLKNYKCQQIFNLVIFVILQKILTFIFSRANFGTCLKFCLLEKLQVSANSPLSHISVIAEKLYHLFLEGPFSWHVWNFIFLKNYKCQQILDLVIFLSLRKNSIIYF